MNKEELLLLLNSLTQDFPEFLWFIDVINNDWLSTNILIKIQNYIIKTIEDCKKRWEINKMSKLQVTLNKLKLQEQLEREQDNPDDLLKSL